jgi:hypothetical protein
MWVQVAGGGWPSVGGGVCTSLSVVPGAIAIVVVLLIFPTLILIGAGAAAAVLGFFLQRDGEQRFEGSELLALDD